MTAVPTTVGGHGKDGVDTGLKRSLGLWDLVAIGVGGVIGAGIFVLTGVAAAEYAGPAIVLSYLISGIGCGFAALCYAELSSMVPVAGSAYAFATATLGELWGFIIGWDLILEYGFGSAAVAVGWSSYVHSGLKDAGMLMAPFWSSAPVAWDIKNEVWLKTAGGIDILAVVVVLGTALLQVRGIAESARFNNVVVVLKLVVLLLFILAGFVFLKPENYDPFIPPNTGTFGVYGWSGILRGSSVVFFSFIGFDALSCNAGEAINPQVTVPLATVITLTLCTVLYILAALVMTGLAKYTTLGTADPIAVAVNAAGPSLYWLRPIVKLGAIAGLTSVVMVQVLGQARIFWAMAEDGLLPPVFAKLHPVYRTPYVTTAFTGITAGIIAGLLPIDVLGEMVSIGTLFAFAIVCAGVMVLRRTQPDLPRPFRTPHANVTGTLGILTCVAQMFALPAGTWVRFIVWLLLGTCVYYMYSRHHVKPYGARRAALLGLPLDVFTKVEHAAIEAGRHNLTAALQVHNAVVDGSAEAVRATSAQAIVARYWRTVAQATAASVGGARRRSLGAVAAADAQRAVELEWPPLLGAAYEQVEAAQAAAPQVREWGGLLPSPAVSPRGRATGPPRSADYYASLHVESVG